MTTHDVSLPAALSQLLVAFTLEVDDGFEVALGEAGHPEIGLSLIGWTSFLQHADGAVVAIRDVMDRTYAAMNHVAQTAAVYERWNVVEVTPAGAPAPMFGPRRRTPKRAGHATSKGITATSVAHLTEIGREAAVWPSLVADVEARWKKRFGPLLTTARNALADFVEESDVALPEGVHSGSVRGDWRLFPPRAGDTGDSGGVASRSLPGLLSQALLRCTIDVEGTGGTSMALGATTLRVLSPEGMPVAELPLRSGAASQAGAVLMNGAVRSGLAVFGKDPATGLKSVALTPAGVEAQQHHLDVVAGLESRLGAGATDARDAALAMLTSTKAGRLRIAEALRPSEGTSRSGAVRPTLGIRPRWERSGDADLYVGTAQDSRLKELAAQSAALVADPLTYLPHYPVWDQNRGLGP